MKLWLLFDKDSQNKVAPHAGAWIETSDVPDALQRVNRRPPRGGVD